MAPVSEVDLHADFHERGVNTANGASHACDPVVAAGLNDWL